MLPGLTRSLSRLWLDPWEGRLSEADEAARRGWVADLAREAFLSTSGVMVQDVKLFGEGGGSASQTRQSSSIRIKSSQSSDGGIPSSPISTASADARDAAVQRLQLLAPTLRLGDMATAKPSSVLAYWPAERGVGTEDYVSSVAVASESKFDEAKQRLKKIEDRRKAQAEKYKIPGRARPSQLQSSQSQSQLQSQSQSQGGWARSNEAAGGGELPAHPAPAMRVPTIAPTIQAPKMRATAIQAPAVQIMSSQGRGPDSSQSQGLSQFVPVAMSQPMPGAFGDRKKAKKAKRKSGFR